MKASYTQTHGIVRRADVPASRRRGRLTKFEPEPTVRAHVVTSFSAEPLNR